MGVKCYQLVFQQQYNFLETAKTLEPVVQRLQDFLFLLVITRENKIPLVCLDSSSSSGSGSEQLFNSVAHVAIIPTNMPTDMHMHIYASIKLRRHYAIPFTTIAEPFPLYRVEVEEPLIFAFHARQRQETSNIASYLRKHDRLRTSIFYAYGEAMVKKLQSVHYHCSLFIASNSRITLQQAFRALPQLHFAYTLKSNSRKNNRFYTELFKKPKKPLIGSSHYPILSSTELVSLMLPDSITGIRVLIDGIRPYTTGRIL